MSLPLSDAALFSMQAGLGSSFEEIKTISKKGKSHWLNKQMSLPMTADLPKLTQSIWQHFKQDLIRTWGREKIVGNIEVLPYWFYFRMAWWDTNLKTNETVRHRMALMLSEILVISDQSNLQLNAHGFADYYQLLYKHAFGNYADLLYDVAMHPMMGSYLSHLNNPKADPENNIHPDENFAREIMQLFSIGLYELNEDGTQKLDAQGKPIPTYDNDDIKEYAKVFTGLAPGGYWWEWEDYSYYPVEWGNEYNQLPTIDATKPMQLNEDYHDRTPKRLLNGLTLPARQNGYKDIRQAIEGLVNHPSCAPFISKRLIQTYTTSNPSKAYVKRVAQVFRRTQGNLGEVLKAILLDKEASSGQKMKEPMLRLMQVLRGFNAHNQSNRLWGTGFVVEERLGQHPFSAPSVFNFFLPDYAPHGSIEKSGKVAPEFQLMDAATSIDYVNHMYDMFFGHLYLMVSTHASQENYDRPEVEWQRLDERDMVNLDLRLAEKLAAKDLNKLLDYLDLMMTAGRLNRQTRNDIKNAVSTYKNRADWVVETAMFMISISPDFTILGGRKV